MRATARLAAVLLAFSASAANAGGPLYTCDLNNEPIRYVNTKPLTLNYDLGALGSRTKAQADAMVDASVALWTNVGTASVPLTRGADMLIDVTADNFISFTDYADGLSPVVYDMDGSIADLVFGIGGKSAVLGFALSNRDYMNPCQYGEGHAVINGYYSVSDATMAVVLAHEIGHMIGLDHTQLNENQGLISSDFPLMYPIAARTLGTLHEDDVAAVSALYPGPTLNSTYGQLSGTLVLGDGVTSVRGANIWARETTTSKVYSIVSDYLMQFTGYFKLLLPPGNYNLYLEPINSYFHSGSSVGPFAKDMFADASFLPPLYVNGIPMPTITLGNATPTSIAISAGCAANLTFRLDGNGTVGGNCTGTGNFVLNVGKLGTGPGTVATAAGGIDCGPTCSKGFASGATVTLTATPTAGSTFAGWNGVCMGTTATCDVTMNSDILVTATFLPLIASNEIFPLECRMPVGWTVPGNANTGWSVVFNDKAEGICSLKSNTIFSFQKAQIQYTGTLAAGNITFNRRVSSDMFDDCFHFYIDGERQSVDGSCIIAGYIVGTGASGIVPWGRVSVPVSAGVHTLTWSYEKGFYTTMFEDAAYIDALFLPLPNAGTIQFTAVAAQVSESAGNATVSVSRTGGSNGPASVNFATSSNYETVGDFIPQAGTLYWAAGDGTTKTITVPIVSDTLLEGNETFTITLSSPGGATLGPTAAMTVIIVDDDITAVPGPPGITAVMPGNTVATVSFTPPGFGGSSAIIDYAVDCGGGSTPRTGTYSPITVSGLNNGTAYNCSVTARNGAGTSPASASVVVMPSINAALALVSVSSRKVHAGLGHADIDINPSIASDGLVSIEPRLMGAAHQLVFKFNNSVSSPGNVVAADGNTNLTDHVSSSSAGDEVIVAVSGLPDIQRLWIQIYGVNGSFVAPRVSLGYLTGDVSGNRAINASDISAVKAQLGQTVTATNFMCDLNLDGNITQADVQIVKARSGLVLP